MNCFFLLLILITLVGLAITQLALHFYTDGWLWPALHGILFLVSFRLVFPTLLIRLFV